MRCGSSSARKTWLIIFQSVAESHHVQLYMYHNFLGPYLFLQPLNLTDSNLVHGVGEYAKNLRRKIFDGFVVQEHTEVFGTPNPHPNLILQPLKRGRTYLLL